MRTLLFVLVLSLIQYSLCACDIACTTSLSSCISQQGATPCNCYTSYFSCCTDPTDLYYSSFCTSAKAVCPSVGCTPSASPIPTSGVSTTDCLACGTTYSQCVTANPASAPSVCSCGGTYYDCLKTKCSTIYASLDKCSLAPSCPEIASACGPPTGMYKCSSDYATCIRTDPNAVCTCIGSLKDCIYAYIGAQTNSTLPTSSVISECIAYPQCAGSSLCPNFDPSTLTGCPKCSYDYASCAQTAIKSGSFSDVCNCLSSFWGCLNAPSCGLVTSYSGLCGILGGVCPNMQCAGRTSASPLANQISALISQYRSQISQNLQAAFGAGFNFNFGTPQNRPSGQAIPVVLQIPDTATIQSFLAEFRTKLAEILKVEISRLQVLLTTQSTSSSVKRELTAAGTYNAEVVIAGSSSAASSAVFSFGVVLLALVSLLLVQ